jgi:hypothetical protein
MTVRLGLHDSKTAKVLLCGKNVGQYDQKIVLLFDCPAKSCDCFTASV